MFRIANAPVSWGVIEQVPGQRLTYPEVLDGIAQSGYPGTELGDWGFLPTDPRQLRDQLESRDLRLVGSWVGVPYADRAAHAEGERRAVQTARLLAEVGGPQALIILGEDPQPGSARHQHAGRIRPEHGLSGQDWQVFIEGVTRIAEAVREQTGLRSAFHPHTGVWIETPEETRELLRRIDPSLVGLCLDTGHFRFGGGDPVAGLREHGDRVWHVHFKDHDPVVAGRSRAEGWDYDHSIEAGVFCELGQGEVDFPAALAVLREIEYQGWIVVEQDVLPGMGTPSESAKKSREYLRRLGI